MERKDDERERYHREGSKNHGEARPVAKRASDVPLSPNWMKMHILLSLAETKATSFVVLTGYR